MWVRLLITAAALVASGCQLPPISPGTPVRTEEYRVAPPDVLSITVSPAPEVGRDVTIRPDGQISLDLIGDLMVEGQTIAEIREAITSRMRRFIVSPTVTVTLQSSQSRRYYVFGQVRRPGAFPLIGRVTAAEALAGAGGETLFASRNASRLTRGGGEGSGVFGVRYDDIILRADNSTNYELLPDDVIYVPPNLSARIGFAIQNVLFPFHAILGLGRSAAATSRGF